MSVHRSVRAERSVAGALVLLESDAVTDLVVDALAPDDCTDPAARAVVTAAGELRSAGHPLTRVGLIERCRANGTLDVCGGEVGIDALSAEAAPFHAVRQLCADVTRLALFRRRTHVAYALAAAADEGDDDAWASAEVDLHDLDRPASGGGYCSPHQIADALIESLSGADPVRWPWPLPSLNQLSGGGARRGQLTGIFGPSSHGKSGFLDCCLQSMGAAGASCLLFVNEMTVSERAERIAANLANVPFSTIQRASAGRSRLEDHHAARLIDAMGSQPVAMVACAGWGVEQIIREARRRKPDVVALDIVQKLPFVPGVSRTQVLEDAVQRLDAFAKDTGAHVLFAGQVNRQRADGTFPVPGMADIKDCAELGNGPDNVLFVWREQDRRTLEMEPEGVVRVAKYRGGRLETIDAIFQGEYQRWVERAQADSWGAAA